MAVTTEIPGPYAPPATILDVIHRFRERGMQTPFTRDVLSRAGVTGSLVSRVLHSLRVLDLIDDDGNPTDVLDGIRKASNEEHQARLAEWLRAAYAEVFQYADPEQDDPSRIRDAFRSYEPVAQQSRMVTLFLNLCQAAGIRENSQEGAPRKRATQRSRASKKVYGRTSNDRRPRQSQPEIAELPQPITGLLASLPDSRRWSKERRDNFLKTFEAVLDFCIEVGDEPEVEDDQ